MLAALATFMREVVEKMSVIVNVVPEDLMRRVRVGLFISAIQSLLSLLNTDLDMELTISASKLEEAMKSKVFTQETREKVTRVVDYLRRARRELEEIAVSLMIKATEPEDVDRLVKRAA